LYIKGNIIQFRLQKEIKMKTNRSDAAKRLFKRLSALRATLPADERKILDSLIVTEVEAHRFSPKVATGKGAAPKAAGPKAEVRAHRLQSKFSAGKVAVTKTNPKAEVKAHKFHWKASAEKLATPKAEPKAEVRAHRLQPKLSVGKVAVSKQLPRIEFDRDTQEYKLIE
jgi:hypothetical protein